MKESAFKTQVGGSHYKQLAIQPTEYCQKNRLGHCESEVVKYVTRHGKKGGRGDIEKAIHFLHLLLEIDYPEEDEIGEGDMEYSMAGIQGQSDGAGRVKALIKNLLREWRDNHTVYNEKAEEQREDDVAEIHWSAFGMAASSIVGDLEKLLNEIETREK